MALVSASLPKLSYIQSFCAVAQGGSLVAAAQETGISQPTLSRHVAALEEDLGVVLFERSGKGLQITDDGARLLDYALRLNEAASQFALTAISQSKRIEGTVKIAATPAFAAFILPDVLRELAAQEPGIRFEILASDETANLLLHEADIAVRMYRPEQGNLIAAKIGELPLGAFATPAYLAERGEPQTLGEALEHDLIGMDTSGLIDAGLKALGLAAGPDLFRYSCEDYQVSWQLILAGAGIGLTYAQHGAADPRVRRILQDVPLPVLPVWLTCHSELKSSARIRLVFDHLRDALGRRIGGGVPGS